MESSALENYHKLKYSWKLSSKQRHRVRKQINKLLTEKRVIFSLRELCIKELKKKPCRGCDAINCSGFDCRYKVFLCYFCGLNEQDCRAFEDRSFQAELKQFYPEASLQNKCCIILQKMQCEKCKQSSVYGYCFLKQELLCDRCSCLCSSNLLRL